MWFKKVYISSSQLVDKTSINWQSLINSSKIAMVRIAFWHIIFGTALIRINLGHSDNISFYFLWFWEEIGWIYFFYHGRIITPCNLGVSFIEKSWSMMCIFFWLCAALLHGSSELKRVICPNFSCISVLRLATSLKWSLSLTNSCNSSDSGIFCIESPSDVFILVTAAIAATIGHGKGQTKLLVT